MAARARLRPSKVDRGLEASQLLRCPMAVLRFTSLIKNPRPHQSIRPRHGSPGKSHQSRLAQAASGSGADQRRAAVPWRINMMPVGAGVFICICTATCARLRDEGRRARPGGGSASMRVPERPQHPEPSCSRRAARKFESDEELGCSDSEPEEGDSPLFHAAEIDEARKRNLDRALHGSRAGRDASLARAWNRGA